MDWKDVLSQIKIDNPSKNEHTPANNKPNDGESASNQPKETLRISIDRRQRKGKTATLIEGFICDDDDVRQMAATLKSRFGTGGSARGGDILLQGDWKEKAAEFLRGQGYKIKMC